MLMIQFFYFRAKTLRFKKSSSFVLQVVLLVSDSRVELSNLPDLSLTVFVGFFKNMFSVAHLQQMIFKLRR